MSTQLRLGETPHSTPSELTPIRFTVIGKPQPQGSTRAFIPKGWKRAIITTDNAKLKPWRQQISDTALSLNVPMFRRDVPLEITVRCYFTRPKSVSEKKRPAMTTKPDGDKLLRAVLDSLTGILFEDDSQATDKHVHKRYGLPERVEIEVQEVIV